MYTRNAGQMLGILFLTMMLVSTGSLYGQDKKKDKHTGEIVHFELSGTTYMSNIDKPELMLDLVEKLQQNKQLKHFNVSSNQNLDEENDANQKTLSRFKMNVRFAFDNFDQFQSWFQSSSTTDLINSLKDKLNEFNMELNVSRK